MSGNQVRILADSINPHGCRLTTFLLKFPRIILAEYNTHKMVCKNTSSSRAIKFEKMVESVEGDPFIPFAFQKHHAGMQGQEYLSGWQEQEARVKWVNARDAAIDKAKQLYHMGVTKQICNRLLEPFSWVTMVSSATEWQNFFALRAHKDAEIHLQDLAYKMLEAYNSYQPNKLEPGEWHVPFGDYIDESRLLKLIDPRGENNSWDADAFEEAKRKISIARIARTSYNNFQGKDDYEADIKLFDRLFNTKPRHCFDKETEIMTEDGFVKFPDITKDHKVAWVCKESGKFIKFDNPLDVIHNTGEHTIYHYLSKDIDLKVTDGHTLYFHNVVDAESRGPKLKMQLLPANTVNKPFLVNRSIYRTIGEKPIRMVNKTFGSLTCNNIIDGVNQYEFGKLCGFFIGDGSLSKSSPRRKIYFHLTRDKKIKYLRQVCESLNIECNTTPNGANHIVCFPGLYLADLFRGLFYNSESKKTINRNIFTCSQEFIDGLFNGLRNSDGSETNHTWVYSTSSEELKDRIIELGTLFGYCFQVICRRHLNNPNHNIGYILNCRARQHIICNTTKNNRVSISQKFDDYYCVNIDNNIVITRRNGKIILSGNCSPAESVAQCMDDDKFIGPFQGWKQYRKFFDDENLTDQRVKNYG